MVLMCRMMFVLMTIMHMSYLISLWSMLKTKFVMLPYNKLCLCYVIFYHMYKEKLIVELVLRVVCKISV